MKKALMILGGIFLVLIVLGVMGAAMGGKSNTGTEKVGTNNTTPAEQTQEVSAPTSVPQETSYKVGDQVKSGDFVFSVNSVRQDQGSAYIKPKAGSVYVIPNVTIQNNGKEKAIVSTLLQMYIKDNEGNKYQPTLTQDATGKVDGELLAGDKIKGDVGFEILTTAKELKFYFTPAWLTGSTIVVNLEQ